MKDIFAVVNIFRSILHKKAFRRRLVVWGFTQANLSKHRL